MEVRNCKECGEYRYIEREGKCRDCLLDDFAKIRNADLETVKEWFPNINDKDENSHVERYWTDKPYSYVEILQDGDGFIYQVEEPVLTESEKVVLDETCERIIPVGEWNITRSVASIAERYGIDDNATIGKLSHYAKKRLRGCTKVDVAVSDEQINKVYCDENQVYVSHEQYGDIRTKTAFEEDELRLFIRKLAHRNGGTVSFSDTSSILSASDERINNISFNLDNPSFTIQKSGIITPVDLISDDFLDIDQMAYLWTAVENERNVVFVGDDSSENRSFMNAVMFFATPDSGIISIDDSDNISLPQKRTHYMETNRNGKSSSLRSAMRSVPNYIILDEIEGQDETQIAFHTMSTTGGFYTTIQSNGATEAVKRVREYDVPEIVLENSNVLFVQQNGGRIRELVRSDEGQFEARKPCEYEIDDGTLRAEYRDLDDIDYFAGKKHILDTLATERIRDTEKVALAIQSYMKNPRQTMSQISKEETDYDKIRNIVDIDFGHKPTTN